MTDTSCLVKCRLRVVSSWTIIAQDDSRRWARNFTLSGAGWRPEQMANKQNSQPALWTLQNPNLLYNFSKTMITFSKRRKYYLIYTVFSLTQFFQCSWSCFSVADNRSSCLDQLFKYFLKTKVTGTVDNKRFCLIDWWKSSSIYGIGYGWWYQQSVRFWLGAGPVLTSSLTDTVVLWV